VLVLESIVIARLPALRLERCCERVDPERTTVRAQRDVIGSNELSARREQPMNAIGLRCGRDVISPQRVEQLGSGHSLEYASR
jgi:hypothetical protein